MEENEKNVAEATEKQTTETAPAAENAQEAAPAAPENTTEGGEAAAGEGANEPNSRDLFYERIRANFPDSNYEEDEQGIYRDAMSRLDALEKDSKSYKDLSEKMSARLDKDPREAEVMLDWLDGVDFRTAIARHMGPEALTAPEEGSEEYENWNKAGEERRKELADMKAKVDEYRANADASAADLQSLAEENGWSDEERTEVENYITDVLNKVYSGRLDKDFYNNVLKARNYDNDIAGAREQGRVDGRNEKIEVEKKHLAGSGLPNGKSGGNASEEVDAKPAKNTTVDFLDKLSKRRV